MIDGIIDTNLAFRAMSAFVALWACLSGLEQLSSAGTLEDDGLLSWRVFKLYFQNNTGSRFVEPFVEPTGFKAVLVTRIVFGVLLAGAAALDALHPALFGVLFLTDVVILYRILVGLSGAYHMVMVMNIGLFLGTLFPEGSVVRVAAILFMAVQGILAYAIAGYLKLISSDWRSGTGLQGVFATYTFGENRVYDLLTSYPNVSLFASWSVIIFECLYPLVLVVDPSTTTLFFGTAIVFHLMNGLLMGLNGFILIFPASYFPVYLTNLYVHQWFL
ncbi:hypothetical protein [Halorubellus litoreus]|uniref:HTTM domain-containing protein n=1 Tax=Halorubellus litoreus TaxID=755308 RepID=A0ABD5VFA7_9EURY